MADERLQFSLEGWEELITASAPASTFLAGVDLEVLLARGEQLSDRLLQDRWGLSRRRVREIRKERPAAERFAASCALVAELAAPGEPVPSGVLLIDPEPPEITPEDRAWVVEALDERPAPERLVERFVEELETADELPRSWDHLLRKVKHAHSNGAISRRYSWPEVEAALWRATRQVAPELVRR